MIVLDLAPAFAAGLLYGKATSAEWRTWARFKFRRLAAGMALTGERWEVEMRQRIKAGR